MTGELTSYDIARQALSLALTVDEAKSIHDDAERLEFYARQAKDKDLIADAIALVMRARRRLGELLIAAQERGEISKGGRPSKASAEMPSRVTLRDIGIDKKLSAEAQKLARYEEELFEEVIERGRDKIRAGAAVVINPVKDLKTADKQARRAVREAQLAARQKALPEKKYGVILADPEWQFDTWSEAGKDRAADNHYPTSSDAVIAARPVGDIAADDCVLFLWTPCNRIDRALAVMAAWGFDYKSLLVWDKVSAGTGFWFRDRAEILLVGTRGSVPAPAAGEQWENLVASPKGVHSAKPDWGYDLIEQYFPNLSKIELNARRAREGWDAWGLEAPEQDTNPVAKPVDEAVAGDAMSEGEAVASFPETAETGSRLEAGRTASATSEGMDVTSPGGENPALLRSGREAASRLAHNQEIAGSSPAPATSFGVVAGDDTKAGAGENGGADPLLAAPDQSDRDFAADQVNVGSGRSDLNRFDRPTAGEVGSVLGEALPAAGEGEDPEKQAPVALPGIGFTALSDRPRPLGQPLDVAAIRAIIAEGYAADTPLDELAARTGLTPNAVQQRAKRMGLGSRDRQRRMASAFATKQHQDRGIEA